MENLNHKNAIRTLLVIFVLIAVTFVTFMAPSMDETTKSWAWWLLGAAFLGICQYYFGGSILRSIEIWRGRP
jgi:hypothetical protein